MHPADRPIVRAIIGGGCLMLVGAAAITCGLIRVGLYILGV